MNTKPKAKKFRVRRSLGLAERGLIGTEPGAAPKAQAQPTPQAGAAPQAAAPQTGAVPAAQPPARPKAPPQQAGVQQHTAPPPQAPAAQSRPEGAAPQASAPQATAPPPMPRARAPQPEKTAENPDGLSTRQLRMARRLADRKGLKVGSDQEAVEALRARGIDPFSTNRLQIVPGKKGALAAPAPATAAQPAQGGAVQKSKPSLPQTVQPQPVAVPSAPELAEDRRAAEIMRMQQDIAKRRRRKLAALGARLFAFILIPTAIAGYYYTAVATPMYSTYSEFIIQQAESPQSSGAGGLLTGTSLASSPDSISIQAFLLSREAMLRLNRELSFKAHFSDPTIDPLQRLASDATNEAAYRVYKKKVSLGYDPSEGIIRMEVVAADPQVGLAFSNALIAYAEERVDQKTQEMRTDRMTTALAHFDDAESEMNAAQIRVLELQQARGVLSAEAEVSSLMGQISTFEVELKKQRLSLQTLMDNARPNATKVEVARKSIARLEALIGEMRAEMTQGNSGDASLAQITGELVIGEAALETRRLMMSQALQQLETARIEVSRRLGYVLLDVKPTASDEASYPRAFENTLLAFLILSGVYLMLSLTASILREQVSG